jgi:hypothetical protein
LWDEPHVAVWFGPGDTGGRHVGEEGNLYGCPAGGRRLHDPAPSGSRHGGAEVVAATHLLQAAGGNREGRLRIRFRWDRALTVAVLFTTEPRLCVNL